MNASKKTTLRSIEFMFWLFGLVCVSAYGVTKIHSARAQSAAISDLEAQWREEVIAEPDQSLWSTQRIAHHEQARSESDALSPLALLTMPSVGIRVAVFEGTSDRVLNLGVGRVPGTGRVGARGNLALAGHRDGFFRGLKDIEVGDDISIQYGGGIDHYRVTELWVVEPDAVHVLEPTEETTLTLVTCYPFYFVGPAPRRFIVRAVAKRSGVFSQ
jgi:sortase A